MPRPSNTEERRDQITGGLLEVMARDGYERATIVAIAEASGLASGLVHYHFASKQEILLALIAALESRRDARASARVDAAGDDARARLFAFVDAHVERGHDADPRAVAAWVVIGTEALRQPEVHAAYVASLSATLERLRSLVLAVLRAEKRKTKGVSQMAAAIVAAIEGAYRLGTSAPELVPAGFAQPMLRAMVTGMLSQEPRG